MNVISVLLDNVTVEHNQITAHLVHLDHLVHLGYLVKTHQGVKTGVLAPPVYQFSIQSKPRVA